MTGDVFNLDEALFWANWNMASKNPVYREYGKGLIHSEDGLLLPQRFQLRLQVIQHGPLCNGSNSRNIAPKEEEFHIETSQNSSIN